MPMDLFDICLMRAAAWPLWILHFAGEPRTGQAAARQWFTREIHTIK